MSALPRTDDLRAALAGLDGQPVALSSCARGRRIASLVHHLSFGRDVPDTDIHSALSYSRGARPRGASAGNVAVVELCGVALPRLHMPPFAYSSFRMADQIAELAADPAVQAILIVCDGPGGAVTGTTELHQAIAQVRKPVAAHIVFSASANYWAASAADHLIITQSGECGSIGCYLLHIALNLDDVTATYIQSRQSPHKTELNPFQKPTDDALAFAQKGVDSIGRQSVGTVAKSRNVTTADVEMKFGGGRVLQAREALQAGMVDAVGDFGSAVRAAQTPATTRAARLARLARDPAPRPMSARRQRLEILRA